MSSIFFGKLFLSKRQFFSKYFNIFTYSILFVILASLIVFPINKCFNFVLYNIFIFSFYSFILYLIIRFILRIIEYFYPDMASPDFRDLKNPYIILSMFVVLFNYFYYICYRTGSNPLLYINYIYFNFFTFMNLIITLILIFARIISYFVIVLALNYLINKIIPQIPIFSNNVLFILNIVVFAIVYFMKFVSRNYHIFKLDFLDFNMESLKAILLLLIINAVAIIGFITCEISIRLYRFFARMMFEKHEISIANDEPVRDNRILYSLVYNSRSVRILLMVLLSLILIKFLIIIIL